MAKTLVFDMPHTVRITEARIKFLNKLLPELKDSLGFGTALDVGCGVGYFSRYLADLDLRVTAVDLRNNNVEEAKKRSPDVQFHIADIEDRSILELGSFDLVFCFGLLYHLENPFRAIRNLYSLTASTLLIETMCIPEQAPVLCLRDEPQHQDQASRFVALIPSEACLVQMCHRAGFPFVYRCTTLPDHEHFRSTLSQKRVRTMLAASKAPLKSASLELAQESRSVSDPWSTIWTKETQLVHQLRRFLQKPRVEQAQALRSRLKRAWNTVCPGVPLPVRLPFGWWLAANDTVGDEIVRGVFEQAERLFVEQFLRPQMIVLDIGAHHGFYTLLASKKVGPQGQVIAFEPSRRERQKLLRHLRINGCSNVRVEAVALGSSEAEAQLFVVKGRETGCNSLRLPNTTGPTDVLPTSVVVLDNYLSQRKIQYVDFIKMDVEGGELDVLKGAVELLTRRPRPVILCEVQDIRTQPWGYKAREIISFLRSFDYGWFTISSTDGFESVLADQEEFDDNFIAVPRERMKQMYTLAGQRKNKQSDQVSIKEVND
jgi:FkbM family methyltransferase